jgi:thiol-disulfide isomerase/thioredoxin
MNKNTPDIKRKIGKSKKAFITFQVVALVVFAGALGGFFAFTEIYEEVRSVIVTQICLSCIKLDRVYTLNYEVETANGKPHPDYILEDLKDGIIFLEFRTDVCAYCDDMAPLIKKIFNTKFEMEDIVIEVHDFNGTNVKFYHINNDHAEEPLKSLMPYYDVDGYGGVPMFTIITLNYHKGIVKPYYLTFYGILNPDYTDEERIEEITNNIHDAIEVYNIARPGYKPEFIK